MDRKRCVGSNLPIPKLMSDLSKGLLHLSVLFYKPPMQFQFLPSVLRMVTCRRSSRRGRQGPLSPTSF